MKRKNKLLCLICSSIGFAGSNLALGEVKSLSSTELTETYIKDSTIIVTPKQNEAAAEQKTYSSLTIAPVEGEEQDISLLQESQSQRDEAKNAFELSDELLRNASVDAALSPLGPVDIPTFTDLNTIPVAEILDDERYTVPEGDFDYPYLGDNLGLSRTGDQLTFSIGAPKGVPNPINVPPEGFSNDIMELIPRAGGGFDLTINIPQND